MNFKDFVNKSETNFSHLNVRPVHLYIDNGTEYLSNHMKQFCFEKGITYHLTIPYTPHKNGVAERMIRTITEKARTLLIHSKLPKSFWGEAILTATFLVNITPTKATTLKQTPFEKLHGKKPLLRHLKVFGSTVFVLEKTVTNKFEEKSWKGILVGYTQNGSKFSIPQKMIFILPGIW